MADGSRKSQLIEIIPKRDDCVYTKCYCEENVWKLCEHISKEHPEQLTSSHVVFISNTNKMIPIWQQTSSKGPTHPVIWDYHVVLLYVYDSHTVYVYDLDTRLTFPCELHEYLARAIRPDEILQSDYHRMFRVVRAADYLRVFASDRSHMLKEDNTWMAAPPSYPCIHAPESKNNLQDFINMDKAVGTGCVYTTNQLAANFGSVQLMVSKYLEYQAHTDKGDSDHQDDDPRDNDYQDSASNVPSAFSDHG